MYEKKDADGVDLREDKENSNKKEGCDRHDHIPLQQGIRNFVSGLLGLPQGPIRSF